jgi:hypothetical protein
VAKVEEEKAEEVAGVEKAGIKIPAGVLPQSWRS